MPGVQRFMKFVKKYGVLIAICSILLAAIIVRFYLYGDPRLSIGMPDTQSYVDSSRSPLFSWTSLTSRRLFTMNLMYKVFIGNNDCQLTSVGYPAANKINTREFQNCFEKIALFQNLLSILGWSFLAWAISRHLQSSFLKIFAVVSILIFALSPQIAEWDSVLSSESLTLSLFSIIFALLIEAAFLYSRGSSKIDRFLKLLVIALLLILPLWVFVRDANLYILPVSLLIVLPIMIRDRFKKKLLWAISIVLAGVFIAGLVSSVKSMRWHQSMQDTYRTSILAYPKSVDFIESLGAPDPNNAAFSDWFNSHAASTYMIFLAVHPRFVISNLFYYKQLFISDYLQPYFDIQEIKYRDSLVEIGEFFHPESGSFYLIDAILMFVLIYAALKKKEVIASTWAWLGAWLFLSAAATLFISYFGDSEGTLRHIFPYVALFRLFLWVFLIVEADLFVANAKSEVVAPEAGLLAG
jgi:hypothetical protein